MGSHSFQWLPLGESRKTEERLGRLCTVEQVHAAGSVAENLAGSSALGRLRTTSLISFYQLVCCVASGAGGGREEEELGRA